MRYFSEIAFDGSQYAGWQRQPNALTVQEIIEETFATVFRQPVEITGCGRTDAGVHAEQFFFHFDCNKNLHAGLPNRLNSMLPDEIAVRRIFRVDAESHARFSAVSREYQYNIISQKDPFSGRFAWAIYNWDAIDQQVMQQVADMLPAYHAFFPFCKTRSDANHYQCDLMYTQWDFNTDSAKFTIRANRFLRGMVRLIVGACLEAGRGKLAISDIQNALDQQTPMPRALSVPAQGLALTTVQYPW